MKLYQRIFAALFILCLYGFSVSNLVVTGSQTWTDLKELGDSHKAADGLQEYTAAVDALLVDNLVGGHFWNEVYGTVYAALGKSEENNFSIVKDRKGFLQRSNFWNTTDITAMEAAQRVRRMQDDVEELGTKVIFLMYPSKYDEKRTEGIYGISYENADELGDEFLRYLRRYNVDYIDFRNMDEVEHVSEEDMFYVSDHHWKAETGFYIMEKIVEHLNQVYDAGLDPDGFFRNPDNYVTETYKDIYMGSMGRETGFIYSGLDDYTYLYPTFETEFYRQYINSDHEVSRLQGDILKTLINRKYISYDDVYNREMYNSYVGGIYRIERITNKQNPNGINVMFIRDSYSSPVGVFLAPMCSKLNMYWALECGGDYLEEKIEEQKPEYIFIAFTAPQLSDTAMPFYKEEVKAGERGGDTG